MLSLPNEARQRIASEFRFAANKMAESPQLAAKHYFYSAFYGEVNRILNRTWSPELALLHLVLLASSNEIKGRLDATTAGVTVGIPDGFGDIWDGLASELAAVFERQPVDERVLYSVLARIAELAYSATGNGYYLYLKGQMKIGKVHPAA